VRVRLEATKDGHRLVDLETGTVVFGPTFSLAKLSRFSADNRIVIAERIDANEKTAAPAKGGGE
jgi:hypothetical protein